MADITKYAAINGGTMISDFRTTKYFSIFSTKRKTASFAYGFIFVFTVFTLFFAFTPSSSNSSSSIYSDESYRSHFSPIYYYFFPNSSSSETHNLQPDVGNHTKDGDIMTHKNNPNNATILPKNDNYTTPSNSSSGLSKGSSIIKNQTQSEKQSTIGVTNTRNDNYTTPSNSSSGLSKGSSIIKNQTQSEKQSTIGVTNTRKNFTAEKGVVQNSTSDDLVKSLMNCDLFDGIWVKDESYPLYKPGSCSLIDEQFNCFLNGRPDNEYHKLKWKPKGCTLPRLDGSHMLELLRGKRLVFVGDSLNRNMWESLICILRNSLKDQKKVYEEFGRHHFRTEASYSFVFEDYKCTVEFFVSPFLVQEWEAADKNGTKKETLRLDIIEGFADKYRNADIIVFNTGHWWTHEKTSKGKDYYQEGSHVYSELNVMEAFRKALTTWGRWVDKNVNPKKSLVFFRGYSASHFSGGQWNSGGQCDNETEPIKMETYLTPYPPKMTVLEEVLRGMKTNVTYLNVTRMTDYRKDGHPSIYRKQHLSDEEAKSPLSFQDCSHWCLPGVPDAWNEILYAQLLVKLNQKQLH